jgi:hypothetical protein
MLDKAKLFEMLVGATSDELHEAGSILKEAWRNKQQLAKFAFSVGDRVEFKGRGTLIRGTVNRLGKTCIKVAVDDGTRWNVSATLLKKINDPAQVEAVRGLFVRSHGRNNETPPER